MKHCIVAIRHGNTQATFYHYIIITQLESTTRNMTLGQGDMARPTDIMIVSCKQIKVNCWLMRRVRITSNVTILQLANTVAVAELVEVNGDLSIHTR